MFLLFLAVALSGGIPLLAVYGLYYFRVFKTHRSRHYVDLIAGLVGKPENPFSMPYVTIVIPARNEESAISSKIQSIAELDYDEDKIDVVLVDDYSDDQTYEFASKAFERFGLRGTIIKNDHRSGTNASYNTGLLKAKGDLILLTDADVVIERDSLKKASVILANMKDVGAVTARVRPTSEDRTSATAMENTYISFIDSTMIAESAIHSTFPGLGGFILLRREAASPISVSYGSKDGNIALSTLRKGYRYICAPNIVFNERISEKLDAQIRQKTRRAARLVQSILLNYNMAFNERYGQFGKLIFPLRFAMLIICPFLTLVGSLALFLFFLSTSAFLGLAFLIGVCFLLFLGTRTRNRLLRFFSSFTFHQSYLVLGLMMAPRKMRIWNSSSKRRS